LPLSRKNDQRGESFQTYRIPTKLTELGSWDRRRSKVPPRREKQMEQNLTIPRLECRPGLLASEGIHCLTSLNQDSTYSTHSAKHLGKVGTDKKNCGS